jgi:hypothetical protein
VSNQLLCSSGRPRSVILSNPSAYSLHVVVELSKFSIGGGQLARLRVDMTVSAVGILQQGIDGPSRPIHYSIEHNTISPCYDPNIPCDRARSKTPPMTPHA